MKKVLLAMTAVGALAVAAPAAAQYSAQSNGYADVGFGNRVAELQTRLDAGIRSGAIDQREAMRLRWQLRQLSRLERQYSRNGLTVQERTDLQQRMRTLRQEFRVADGGRNGRYGSYDDSYENGAYARVDRNEDGWDDRDYDRDGRIDDNGYYGQGGPYEDAYDTQCQSQGGIGGLISSVLGGGNDCTLRVGQRVSGNLGAVPFQYRNQFRDSNSVYYRSDGRSIYQIDARSNTVLRIYSMNR